MLPSRPEYPCLPRLVVHADWGTAAEKRQMALAIRDDGHYYVSSPQPVGDLKSLFDRLTDKAGENETTLLGFDFPIGLPAAYAARAGISDFVGMLPCFGSGCWGEFYEAAQTLAEISICRPFYPARPGGSSRAHLVSRLGLSSPGELYRRCERATPDRGAASPLFWTLGPKQVGKAAMCGWRDVLAPGLARYHEEFALWPFAGRLQELLRNRRFVVAETYPSEAYGHLGFPRRHRNKRNQPYRRDCGIDLLAWAAQRPVVLAPDLVALIRDGFGTRTDGEDPFDALVGLTMMIDVVLAYRSEGVPPDEEILRIEGWILGQQGNQANVQ